MKHLHPCFVLFFLSCMFNMHGQQHYLLIDQTAPGLIKVNLHDTIITTPSWNDIVYYRLDLDKNNKTDLTFSVQNISESGGLISKVNVDFSDSCLTFLTLGTGYHKKTIPKDTLLPFKTLIGKIFNAQDTLYADSCKSMAAELCYYFEINTVPQSLITEWAGGTHFLGFKKTIKNKDYLGWVKLEIKQNRIFSVTLNEYVIQEFSVGIHELKNSSIILYPNPVSDVLNIKDGSCKKIEIYNALGALLLSEENKNNSTSFSVDVRHLNAGVYFAKIIEQHKPGYSVEKIIKQ